MYGYVFFYNDKRFEVYADSMHAAQLKAVAHFSPPKSKRHMVHGMIAERNGVPVVHTASN